MSKGTKLNTTKSTILSGILLVLDAFAKKAIGLISTLILARVLVPDDFGIIAIAMILLGLADVLSETGTEAYILRQTSIDNDILNSAWTLNLILKLGTAAILYLSAPLAANYYDKPELARILQALCLLPLLTGLRNPGEYLLKKSQNYLPIIKYSVAGKVVSASATISVALIYHSYWALIIGHLVSVTFNTISSYFYHPHRPRINFSKTREQMAFTGWIIPQAIFGYTRSQIDTFIASTTYDPNSLGSYHVMKYLAFMPISELLNPLTQPLFVDLANARSKPDEFRTQFTITLLVTLSIALPIALFGYAFSDLCTRILLGDQWVLHANLFGFMVLLSISFVWFNQTRRLLFVLGKVDKMLWFEVILFAIILATLTILDNVTIETFTMVRVAIEMGACAIFFSITTSFAIGIKTMLYSWLLCIPLFASVLIAIFTTINLESLLPGQILIIKLLILGTAFLVMYAVLIFASYHTIYRKTPEGQRLFSIYKRLLQRTNATAKSAS